MRIINFIVKCLYNEVNKTESLCITYIKNKLQFFIREKLKKKNKIPNGRRKRIIINNYVFKMILLEYKLRKNNLLS